MKRIFLSLCLISTVLFSACDGTTETEQTYDSVITPDFTFTEGDLVGGSTAVYFTNKTSVEGTSVARSHWHFGFAGDGNWSEQETPDPIVYPRTGDFTVTLTVWGKDGNKASSSKEISIVAANAMPEAAFTYSPLSVKSGDEVTFTDTSTDSDGEITSREWTFPDGSTSTSAEAKYTFETHGRYNVTLKVTDDRGGTSSTTKAIAVLAGQITEFTVIWSTPVASSDARFDAGVVTVSDLGYAYFASGEGILVALDSDGQQAWTYDAVSKDGAYLGSELCYPSVDTDGTVFWAAHGWNQGTKTSVYAFNGTTGDVVWTNPVAYGQADRIAHCTPCITPTMLVIGNRGTNGVVRGFDKSTGAATVTTKPANGGVSGATISLKNGLIAYTVSGNYGFGALLPDPNFTWVAVPTAYSFTPGSILTSATVHPCVDANGLVYVGGVVNGSGTWNVACFDGNSFNATSVKSPKWSVKLPSGLQKGGGAISEDGNTLYLVEDAASPSVVYALNTSNGAKQWEYTLDAASVSVPAVDNLGQIHIGTKAGDYVILSATGEVVYKERLASEIDGSVTIAEGGMCYVAGKDTAEGKIKVFAVRLPGVDGPANSAWSQYGQNARHIQYQK